jgi:hypothetical protein
MKKGKPENIFKYSRIIASPSGSLSINGEGGGNLEGLRPSNSSLA